MSPFDIIKNINSGTTEDVPEFEGFDDGYVPFIINRHFSYFPDTVMLANEMNKQLHDETPKEHQYSFYINTVVKRKRFAKWVKKDVNKAVEKLAEHYNCSIEKACAYLDLLTDDEIKTITTKEYGGT